MSDDLNTLFATFHQQLTAARSADQATAKLDQFMDAYETFIAIHEALDLPVPTVHGERMTKNHLRAKVTADDLGTEWDPDAFEKQAGMMEDKIREVKQLYDQSQDRL